MTRRAPTTTPTTTPTLHYFTAPPARRVRFIAWIACLAMLLGGTLAWIFLLRGPRILNNDPILIAGWAMLGALIIAIAVLLKTSPSDAIRISTRTSAWLIIGGSALLQGTSLVLLAPELSEDLWRYRIDGRMWLKGTSPYAVTPKDFRPPARVNSTHDAKSAFGGDLESVGLPHSELHTIYPPVAQLVFASARFVDDRVTPPGQWPFWRGTIAHRPFLQRYPSFLVLFAACAVFSVAVLLSILTYVNRSPWYAVLLGWNPLFVIETGGMGHVDIVGVLFILLTIRALQSKRPIFAAAMLALAAGVKPHVVFLAPFLVRDAMVAAVQMRARWILLAFVGFLAIVYSPMLYQRGYEGWLRTSKIYAMSWEANGSIYDLIKSTADETDGWSVQRAKDRARLFGGAMVIATMLIAWLYRADLPMAGYWIFLVALLVSPVVYPWYLLWVLCFVPLLRGGQGMTALVWSATIGVSYLLWRTSDWVLPTRWVLVEYLPVYGMLMIEIALIVRWRRQGATRLAQLHSP